MRYPRLFWGVFLISLQRELAHRANLIFEALRTSVELAAGLVALGVVFARTETLAGWQPAEAVVLLGIYSIMSGVLQTFIEPNLSFFAAEVVFPGKLDDVLLRPVHSALLASLGSCQPWALAQAGVGAGLVAVGLIQRGELPAVGQVAACLLLLAVGVTVTWASRLLLASLAFWAPHLEPAVLYGAFWQLGRYPVGIYHPTIQRVMTYVLPVAFIATLPALALLRGVGPTLLLASPIAALTALLVTNLVWSAGIRRYTSATS